MDDERVASIPLLAVLDRRARKQVLRTALEAHYAPGEAVVREGDPATKLYLIVSGYANVEQEGQRVGHMGPDEFFGELALGRFVMSALPRLALVCLAALLAACAGTSSSTPQTSPSAMPSATATPTASATPTAVATPSTQEFLNGSATLRATLAGRAGSVTIPLDSTCQACRPVNALFSDGRLELYWNDGHPDPGGNYGITASFQLKIPVFASGTHTDLNNWITVLFDLAPGQQFQSFPGGNRTCSVNVDRTTTQGIKGSLDCTGVDSVGQQYQLHGDFTAEP